MEKKPRRGPRFPVEEFPRPGEVVRTLDGQKGIVRRTPLEGGMMVAYVLLKGERKSRPFAPMTLSLEVMD